MTSDPIVDEIRQARAEHAAKYGYDLDRIFSAIKEAEKKYANRLVNRELSSRKEDSPVLNAAIAIHTDSA